MTRRLSERVKNAVPEQELLRRAAGLKSAMKREGIDCVLAQNSTQYLGGAVRWLTDFTAENAYPLSVLMTADGLPNFIACGAAALPYPGKALMRTDCAAYKTTPYFSTFKYLNGMEGEAAVSFLMENKIKKLGIVAMDLLQWNYYEYIAKSIPDLEMVDFTGIFERLRAEKSDAEAGMFREIAFIQDNVMRCLSAVCLPGVREYEVRTQAAKMLQDLGSEEHIIMIGSAPAGEEFAPKPSHAQNRTLEKGDSLYIHLQSSGPGGMYASIGRMFSVGQCASEYLQNSLDAAVQAQENLVSLLKPEAALCDVKSEHNRWLSGKGFEQTEGLFVHGQGCDHIERPASDDSGDALSENNCLAVHTAARDGKACGYLCDSVMLTREGAVKLHKTPSTIIRT